MKYLILNGDATAPDETLVKVVTNSGITPVVGESSIISTPIGFEGVFTIKEIYYWPSEERICSLLDMDPLLPQSTIANDVDALIWIGQQD
jgi:hypothetical protein